MRASHWWILAVLLVSWLLVGTDCKGRPLREAQIVSFEITPDPVAPGGSVRIAWQAEHVGLHEGVSYCTLQRDVAGEVELEEVHCVGSREDAIDASIAASYIDYQFGALRRSGGEFVTRVIRLRIEMVVAVTPASVTLEPGASQDFTATVAGASDSSVTWDASCGSISGSGSTISYTAPPSEDVCEVTATSVANPGVSDTAIVTVAAAEDPDWVPDLVIAFSSGASSMDPVIQDAGNATVWHRHVFDSLTVYDRDGGIQPWIVVGWENVGPTNWRITLRDDVRFHDGTLMTAQDVAFSIVRASTGGGGAMRWYVANLQDATAIDDHTVEVVTATPDPLLPEHLAAVPVVPEALLTSTGASAFADDPVGTGPYRHVRWQSGVYVDLESFPDYWGDAPEFERVRLEAIASGSERTDALLAGTVDIVVGIGPEDLPRVEASPATYLAQVPGLELAYLAMDHVRTNTPGMVSPNPFLDVRVRRAVYHAIDINLITQGVLATKGMPASQLLTPFSEGYDPSIARLPYDPERALELLAEAGYPSGIGVVRFDTPAGRFRGDSSVAISIADMLAAVGIDVVLNTVPSPVFSEVYFESGDSTLALSSWSSFDTSDTLSTVFHCWDEAAGLGRLNRFWYCNAAVDALITSANALFDPAARAVAYGDIMREAQVGDVAYVPLYIEDAIAAVREGVAYEMRADGIVLAADAARAE